MENKETKRETSVTKLNAALPKQKLIHTSELIIPSFSLFKAKESYYDADVVQNNFNG